MKKAVAMVMAVVMMLAFGVTAFAANGPLTVEQAKQAALDYAGVKASEATFTKAHRDWDNGREVYEIEFYANNTEYDMDVDVNTGRIMSFSKEYHTADSTTSRQSIHSPPPAPTTSRPVTTVIMMTTGMICMTVTGTIVMTTIMTGMTGMTMTAISMTGSTLTIDQRVRSYTENRKLEQIGKPRFCSGPDFYVHLFYRSR